MQSTVLINGRGKILRREREKGRHRRPRSRRARANNGRHTLWPQSPSARIWNNGRPQRQIRRSVCSGPAILKMAALASLRSKIASARPKVPDADPTPVQPVTNLARVFLCSSGSSTENSSYFPFAQFIFAQRIVAVLTASVFVFVKFARFGSP